MNFKVRKAEKNDLSAILELIQVSIMSIKFSIPRFKLKHCSIISIVVSTHFE